MASLPVPVDGILVANGKFDLKLPSDRCDVILTAITVGGGAGFDGGSIDVLAVDPLDNSDNFAQDMDAPTSAVGITSNFTGVYKGQKGLDLRFDLTGAGGNVKIKVHVGPTSG